ncbi:hypothetical protein RR48_00549 [Papilio machaon]|uniref:Uncharacterized protein n=1 Tax=Papilio machaon TaxID=76193 RepID=A0A0N1IQN1_PAPMA|nr:hypothetical protein RR48_00549 [Papilio machaon]
MERVTSGAVKELAAHLLAHCRTSARDKACALVNTSTNEDSEALLKSLEALYNSELQQLRGEALSVGTASIKRRAGAALAALLPAAPSPLLSLAVKGCVNRLNKWLNDNWSTTAVLCKDIQQEMKTLQVIGEVVAASAPASPLDLADMMLPDDKFDAVHVSPASAVINLKVSGARLFAIGLRRGAGFDVVTSVLCIGLFTNEHIQSSANTTSSATA